MFCIYIIRLKEKTTYNTFATFINDVSRIYNMTFTCNTVSTKLLNVCLEIDPSILSTIVTSQPPIVVPAQTLK